MSNIKMKVLLFMGLLLSVSAVVAGCQLFTPPTDVATAEAEAAATAAGKTAEIVIVEIRVKPVGSTSSTTVLFIGSKANLQAIVADSTKGFSSALISGLQTIAGDVEFDWSVDTPEGVDLGEDEGTGEEEDVEAGDLIIGDGSQVVLDLTKLEDDDAGNYIVHVKATHTGSGSTDEADVAIHVVPKGQAVDTSVPASGIDVVSKLLDAEGKPVVGAIISTTIGYEATTDSTGEIRFRGFPSSSTNVEFDLTVEATGYETYGLDFDNTKATSIPNEIVIFKPQTPSNLTAIGGVRRITVDWDGVLNASSWYSKYEIYRSTSQTGTFELIGTITSLTDTDFVDGVDNGVPLDAALYAMLTGAAEVPGPGDTDGSGWATIRLKTSEICFNLTVSDIDAATAAHIHEAAAGVAGSVVVTLTAPSTGSSSGCVSVDSATIAKIRQNPAGYYVNVHNAAFSAGAVRGQLSDKYYYKVLAVPKGYGDKDDLVPTGVVWASVLNIPAPVTILVATTAVGQVTLQWSQASTDKDASSTYSGYEFRFMSEDGSSFGSNTYTPVTTTSLVESMNQGATYTLSIASQTTSTFGSVLSDFATTKVTIPKAYDSTGATFDIPDGDVGIAFDNSGKYRWAITTGTGNTATFSKIDSNASVAATTLSITATTNYSPSPSSLPALKGLAFDSNTLYSWDSTNNRLVSFSATLSSISTGSVTAVSGPATSSLTGLTLTNPVSSSTVSTPSVTGLAIYKGLSAGTRLFLADNQNKRIIVVDLATPSTVVDVLPLPSGISSVTGIAIERNSTTTTFTSLANAAAAAKATRDFLWVSDGTKAVRVNVNGTSVSAGGNSSSGFTTGTGNTADDVTITAPSGKTFGAMVWADTVTVNPVTGATVTGEDDRLYISDGTAAQVYRGFNTGE